MVGVLVALGCSGGDGLTTAGASSVGSAGAGVAMAPASPAAAGGGGAGVAMAPASPAAVGGGGAAPVTSAAGSAAPAPPPVGSFKAAYDGALREMCPSCHIRGGIFGSLDLSSEERAYESLVDKDASSMQPGVCGGMGKLVTPGNCETSLLHDKIAQATPKCGRRMPLSSTTVSQAGIDAVCAWIMGGAKKD